MVLSELKIKDAIRTIRAAMEDIENKRELTIDEELQLFDLHTALNNLEGLL